MGAGSLRNSRVYYILATVVFLVVGLLQFPEALSGNLIWDERTGEYIPWRVEGARLIQAGEIPLFTDRVFGGMPVLAIGYTGVLYPPNWLYVLFSPRVSNWLAVLHTIVGGLGMLAYLRGRRLSRFASFCGAVFFVTGTFGLLHSSHIAMREAAMLGPWVAWAAWRIHRWPGLSRASVLGLMLALQVASGYPQITLFTLAWLFFDWLGSVRFSRLFVRRTAVLAMGCALGGMLAAPLILTGRGILDTTARRDVTVEQWMDSSFPPGQSLLFLNPEAYGLPMEDWSGAGYPGEVLITVSLAAWGLFAAALPLWWLMGRRSFRVRRMIALWIGVIVSWLLALGSNMGGYEALFHIPPFNLFRIPPRWLYLTTVLACTGASSGIHALAFVRDWHRVAASLAGAFLFGAIVVILVIFCGEETDTLDRLGKGAALLHFVAAGACLLAACAPRRLTIPAAVAVVIACMVQYDRIASKSFIEPMDASRFFGEAPVSLAITPPKNVTRHFTFRLAEAPYVAETMPHNLALFRGYRSLNGYCPLLHHELGHFPKISGDGGTWMHEEIFAAPSPLEAFAVSHVSFNLGNFTQEQRASLRERDGVDWRVVSEGENVALVELLKTTPRFHLAAQWRAVGEPRPILDNWWQREPAREERTILVDPGLTEHFPPQNQPLGRGAVEVISSGGSFQTIEVSSDAPGVLVIRDAWWPGWRYRLVGNQGVTEWRDVAKAEGMLRAVAVEEGRQLVELQYVPPGWRKGLLSFATGLLLAGCLIAVDRRSKTRK